MTVANIRQKKGFWVITIGSIAMFAILSSLGAWQMQRLAWKNELIRSIEERLHQQAVQVPPPSEWASLSLDEINYRKVEVKGQYIYTKQVKIFTHLSRNDGKVTGPGYWIFTPFKLASSSDQDAPVILFVNRGFIPEKQKENSFEVANKDTIPLRGLMRAPEKVNSFTPESTLENAFTRDPKLYVTQFSDDTQVAPFYLQALESGQDGLPQAEKSEIHFINNHLNYAITWFSCAIVLIFLYGFWVTRSSS